tara:strand:- start:693 stop:1727 length:1035 start_codon:yes stop_codon:yes gene_type:complete
MSKAAELAALIGSQTALSNRNLVINGAAEVYQRGASQTAHNSYSVDRWQLKNTSGATCTHEQSTDAPAPFKNSIKYTAGGTSCSAAQVAGIAQRMEGTSITSIGLGTSAAQPVTLSFYVKSSVTGTYAVSMRNNDTNQSFINTYTISSANTWEYKKVTFDARTTGTWLTTTGIGVRLWFDLGSGSNFDGTAGSWTTDNHLTVSSQADVVGTSSATWFVTGVQLELGEVATPFEHRSFADDLALCQRYYQTMARGAMGGAYSSTQWIGGGNFNTPMRATPTASQPSGVATVHDPSTATYEQSSTDITATYASTTGSTFILGNLSGMNAFRPMSLFGGQIDFSSEL